MLDNELDIFIQEQYIRLDARWHLLKIENFFAIHRWIRASILFPLHTKQELRAVHREFKHPSVRKLELLRRRADGLTIDAEAAKIP